MDKIVRKFPGYETQLAPRLILGLWHPKFIAPAKKHVPTLSLAHIGSSPADALRYFWKDCSAFSLNFPALATDEGQRFLQRAKEEKKDVMVWTVNRLDEMVEATRWGVKAILTDHTDGLQKLRKEMAADFLATEKKYVAPYFRWTYYKYYTPYAQLYRYLCVGEVVKHAGVRTPTDPDVLRAGQCPRPSFVAT